MLILSLINGRDANDIIAICGAITGDDVFIRQMRNDKDNR
jgi:hypothetical protein